MMSDEHFTFLEKLEAIARGEQLNNDERGECRYCGRNNFEYENEPCSDDCPYEQAIAKIKGLEVKYDELIGGL